MGFYHGVAKISVIFSVRHFIKHLAGMVDSSECVGGCNDRGNGGTGCDEFGEEVEICFQGSFKHESMDLEERRFGVLVLEEREAFSLSRAP